MSLILWTLLLHQKTAHKLHWIIPFNKCTPHGWQPCTSNYTFCYSAPKFWLYQPCMWERHFCLQTPLGQTNYACQPPGMDTFCVPAPRDRHFCIPIPRDRYCDWKVATANFSFSLTSVVKALIIPPSVGSSSAIALLWLSRWWEELDA